IVSRVESFEDPQITYEKTVQLLAEQPDLRGIYITCGGVAQVGRALIESGRSKDIRVLCYEDYPEIVELMRQGVIDWTLGGEKDEQGALPVNDYGSAGDRKKARTGSDFHRDPYSGQGMFIKNIC
ncbi:MAG: substrate-binding domain-containing protein, partial [Butyricicoccus sp.]